MMMAPSVAVGSGASSGVKKSRKMTVSAAAMSPTHCVFPPIWSLTVVRDALSAAGNPVKKPAAILAMPMPTNSWLASIFWPCFARKDTRGEDLIRIDQDREREGGRQQRKDILQRDRGDRDAWQSGGHRADDRNALVRPAQNDRGDDGADDDDERARQFAIHAAHDEQRHHADDANGDR